MGKSLARKIIDEHLVAGEVKAGSEIGIRIDQTLTQDATGTMAYLQFEAMGIPRVRTELSVSYVDHNTLQTRLRERRRPPLPADAWPRSTASTSRGRATASATRCTWSASACPGRRCSARTATRRPAAALGMLAIGAGGLDVARGDGAAGRSTWRCRRWCGWS